jgi:hypothetical protein
MMVRQQVWVFLSEHQELQEGSASAQMPANSLDEGGDAPARVRRSFDDCAHRKVILELPNVL